MPALLTTTETCILPQLTILKSAHLNRQGRYDMAVARVQVMTSIVGREAGFMVLILTASWVSDTTPKHT